jgi:hypothetical protein
LNFLWKLLQAHHPAREPLSPLLLCLWQKNETLLNSLLVGFRFL